MSMTKSAIIAAARERADAVRSGRWSDADLGIMLGSLHWREWAHILSANPHYRMHTLTVTPDASGVITKTDLNTATTWYYRILSLKNGSRFFVPASYKDAPTPSDGGYGSQYVWYEKGTGIQLNPPNTDSTDVTVNYRPERASSLDDGETVDFPDGHEHILVYGLAGELLLKGGAETEAANDLFRFQQMLREDMLQDIRRLSVRPTIMTAMDDPADWGGW